MYHSPVHHEIGSRKQKIRFSKVNYYKTAIISHQNKIIYKHSKKVRKLILELFMKVNFKQLFRKNKNLGVT